MWTGNFCDKHNYVEVMEYGADHLNKYQMCSRCLGACLVIHFDAMEYMSPKEIRDSKVIVGHIGFVSGCRKRVADVRRAT